MTRAGSAEQRLAHTVHAQSVATDRPLAREAVHMIRTESVVTLELAQKLTQAARSAATKPMAIAITDRHGELVLATRMDGAARVALTLAVDKAFTAAAFNAPTDAWGEVTKPGAADWGLTSALAGRIVVIAGGFPLRADGELVGAIGVSGAAPHVDNACALAALRACADVLDSFAASHPAE
ncbi:GlcG/HbpS family heme-binding protein [Herbidospora mongoliensis]|uniref:GlcG/HbpS family heme-binding protein n=1 Tax=Herbidospora mongoliensis TaxID=688067 RepID=UPI000A05A7C8|nr:heme-binding protein [Herbidospora mongoliensis]